ncbi:MAG: hypothetical protein ACI8QP_001302 [Porticoccaceae bacterium]|jgi:hypothetical protein
MMIEELKASYGHLFEDVFLKEVPKDHIFIEVAQYILNICHFY